MGWSGPTYVPPCGLDIVGIIFGNTVPLNGSKSLSPTPTIETPVGVADGTNREDPITKESCPRFSFNEFKAVERSVSLITEGIKLEAILSIF